MVNVDKLLALIAEGESGRLEFTRSVKDTTKFCQAVCAFANDVVGSGQPGYLLVGVDDQGQPVGLDITDELLQRLAQLGTDGTILPAPAVTVQAWNHPSGGGAIAIVEVQPSILPPVRYKGQVWIRRGPAKAIANETEERLLTERRLVAVTPFDSQPCLDATLDDIALDLFRVSYLPHAVSREILEENGRELQVQLASLRLFHLKTNTPTHAAILAFGTNPLQFEPHAYIQYVQYLGDGRAAEVGRTQEYSGDFFSMLKQLELRLDLLANPHLGQSEGLRDRVIHDYPPIALREFVLNAVLHRAYDQPTPIYINHFTDRIEVMSPGPLFGLANRTNFPHQTSYRNPTIAEILKTMGFVNRFGRGVARAKAALEFNGSPPAEFDLGDTGVSVTLRPRS